MSTDLTQLWWKVKYNVINEKLVLLREMKKKHGNLNDYFEPFFSFLFFYNKDKKKSYQPKHCPKLEVIHCSPKLKSTSK